MSRRSKMVMAGGQGPGIVLFGVVTLAALATLSSGCDDRRRAAVTDAATLPDAAVPADASVPPRDDDAGPVPTCTPGPEDDVLACSDGCSNDGDAFVDCDDRDCCGVVGGCPASTYCGATPDAAVPACIEGSEDTSRACSDGCSNDGDAFVDCEDFDCCDVVACPASSACGMGGPVGGYVSRSAADCVGTGHLTYAFSGESYDMVTVAVSTSTGYQVFGYTRGDIIAGPFPLTGTTGERQVRVADLGSGLQMALSRWGGSSWSNSEGGAATFSDASTVNLARDAEDLYSTHACVGYLEGSATAGVLGGVDYMNFSFTAPVLGLAFPGVR